MSPVKQSKPKSGPSPSSGKTRSPSVLPPALPAPRAARLMDKLAQAYPGAQTELHYSTPFELLAAVMLSAQATDKSVNLATAKLFPITPQGIVTLGEARLLEKIKTIGLAPTKAKNLTAACRLLLERHGGEVPSTREELEALPGVGRKTANVVLNTAFGQPTLAVDTHVFRLANRTSLAPGKNTRQVEDGLMAAVPPRHLARAHHYLILHGRYVCKARKPDCAGCVIRQECGWEGK